MGADTVDVRVGADLIRPIVEAKVRAAVVEGLGKQEDLMQAVISAVISMKVDRDGKPGQGYSQDQTLLHYLCTKAIRETAEAAVREWIVTQQTKPKAELTRQLDRQKPQLAEAMVLGLGEALKNAWKFNVDVVFSKSGRD